VGGSQVLAATGIGLRFGGSSALPRLRSKCRNYIREVLVCAVALAAGRRRRERGAGPSQHNPRDDHSNRSCALESGTLRRFGVDMTGRYESIGQANASRSGQANASRSGQANASRSGRPTRVDRAGQRDSIGPANASRSGRPTRVDRAGQHFPGIVPSAGRCWRHARQRSFLAPRPSSALAYVAAKFAVSRSESADLAMEIMTHPGYALSWRRKTSEADRFGAWLSQGRVGERR
jgi:hypothetical protein